jgi:hypothetical protein
MRQLELGQAALAPDPVHDLDSRRVAGADAQQEIAECQRLVGVAGGKQRVQSKHRVAQPAVAVVPVPHAADVLGQRGRRRRDHRSRRLRGHRLERNQRRQDLVAIRALIVAAATPRPPPRLRARKRGVGVLDRRTLLVGEMPGQRQPLTRALDRDELRDHGSVLQLQRQRRTEPKRIGTGGGDRAVRRQLDPRSDRPVIRTQRKLHPHRDTTSQPLHDPHHARRPLSPARHEIDQSDRALRGLEVGLEHQRPGPVAPRDRPNLTGRRDEPAPVPVIPNSAEKHEAESKRGRQSQSTAPFRPTRAAASRSPIKP